MAGGLEQRLGLLDVLSALGQRTVIGGIERRVHVVGDSALARQHLLDHLRAVDDQPHRLTHADVAERRLVDAHRERLPLPGVGDEHLESRRALDLGDLAGRQVVDRVDLAAEQRVDARGVVGEVDDRDLVDIGPAGLPVVGELLEHALLPGREALVHERPGADRLGRVIVDGDDRVEVLAEIVQEGGVGELERDPQARAAQLLDVVDVDVPDRCRAEVRRAYGERLVQVPAAHDVGVGGGQMGVNRVLGAAAGGADAQASAGLDRARTRSAAARARAR